MAALSSCGELPLDDIAAALMAEGRLIPLDSLRRGFDVRAEAGAVMYIEDASHVMFVATLERRWLAELAHRRAPATWPVIYRSIVAHGCE